MKRDEIQRPSDDEAIDATAAAWLAQRDDGLTCEDEEKFARWRSEDPRHERAVLRLDRTWTTLLELRDLRPHVQMHPDRDLLRHAPPGLGPRTLLSGLASTALAASLAVAIWWIVPHPHAPEAEKPSKTYATTVDGYEQVTLEDGSLLELNGDSEVRVEFTAALRRVRLLRGEAHFSVAKNPARPFSVEAGDVAVRALGTAFNVRRGIKDIEVLVTEGKVRVSRTEKQLGRPAAVPLLFANERAVISATALADRPPHIEKVAPDAIREALAWQGPRLVFAETPLAEVVAQFNRRNHAQIELGDPELGALPVGGSFRPEDVEALVRLMISGDEIVAERPDATRIVLRKAK